MNPSSPFDSDFNPSPFKDSKDDLEHALHDIEQANKKFGLILNQWKQLIAEQVLQGMKLKIQEFPLCFMRVHIDTIKILLDNEKPERSLFQAGLTRKNKDLVLGFAYDWLVEQQMMNPMILKEEFIINYWKHNFEGLII